jgi:hypothetical protein
VLELLGLPQPQLEIKDLIPNLLELRMPLVVGLALKAKTVGLAVQAEALVTDLQVVVLGQRGRALTVVGQLANSTVVAVVVLLKLVLLVWERPKLAVEEATEFFYSTGLLLPHLEAPIALHFPTCTLVVAAAAQ